MLCYVVNALLLMKTGVY